jgi:hypothetical protein
MAGSEIAELDLRIDELIDSHLLLAIKVGGVKKYLSAKPDNAA